MRRKKTSALERLDGSKMRVYVHNSMVIFGEKGRSGTVSVPKIDGVLKFSFYLNNMTGDFEFVDGNGTSMSVTKSGEEILLELNEGGELIELAIHASSLQLQAPDLGSTTATKWSEPP